MRVFILCTGRTGSVTIIKACQHMENFTASHESRSRQFGEARFDFPDNHIEADNRLSWQLGLLEKHFGEEALYVHLLRDRDRVAKSFLRRYYLPTSMIDAFCEGVKMTPPEKLNEAERLQACYDYVDTVNANIKSFLKAKPHTMTIRLETIKADFQELWEKIGARGDLQRALNEFDRRHNASAKRVLNYAYRLPLLLAREWRHLMLYFKS